MRLIMLKNKIQRMYLFQLTIYIYFYKKINI